MTLPPADAKKFRIGAASVDGRVTVGDLPVNVISLAYLGIAEHAWRAEICFNRWRSKLNESLVWPRGPCGSVAEPMDAKRNFSRGGRSSLSQTSMIATQRAAVKRLRRADTGAFFQAMNGRQIRRTRLSAPAQGERPNHRLGALYAVATAALLAIQEPFSALAARHLRSLDFLVFTEIALLVSVPLLLARAQARRDFVDLLTARANWPRLSALLVIGCAGLFLYDVALSSTHPIIAAAVLNLSPFWAALVARLVSGARLPRPALLFLGCCAASFVGAMIVALSQIQTDSATLKRELSYSLFHSRWALALPMPIFFALSGTLVYKWFRAYDSGASIAANFVVSAVVLIPAKLLFSHGAILPALDSADAPAILLLFVGTLASASAGRVAYQAALTATHNDNGFVSMFFLAIPAISALVTWPLSLWIGDLRLQPSVMFCEGLVLVTGPLVLFGLVASRRVASPALGPTLGNQGGALEGAAEAPEFAASPSRAEDWKDAGRL